VDLAAAIAAFGWPHFAFAFALVSLVLFRGELRGLITRIVSIDKLGIKTSQSTAPELQEEQSQQKAAAQDLIEGLSNSPVLLEVEDNIRKDLVAKKLSVDGETNKLLIRLLSAGVIGIQFEQIHSFIFGSQIYLLKRLNEASGLGLGLALVNAHFEHIHKSFAPSFEGWNLERYLHFLFVRRLVVMKENNYHITNLGKEYLVWLARTGRQEDKAL